VVAQDVTGTPAYCQVVAGGGSLRVEAVSNVYLAFECRLDEAKEASLGHMGFQRPETPYW